MACIFWLSGLFFLADLVAGRQGESLRLREKRQKAMVEALSDYDRSRITEMHAQGLSPNHINVELGLEKSADYVLEVLTAIQGIGIPERSQSQSRRYISAPERRRLESRTDARSIAREHRLKSREAKRGRDTLRR